MAPRWLQGTNQYPYRIFSLPRELPFELISAFRSRRANFAYSRWLIKKLLLGLHVEDGERSVGKRLGWEFFDCHEDLATHHYGNTRGVSERLELPPGTYCIVPALSKHEGKFISGHFLLRVFAEGLVGLHASRLRRFCSVSETLSILHLRYPSALF